MKSSGRILTIACLMAAIGCRDDGTKWSRRMIEGDPERGKAALTSYGCIACHMVPGVRNASALTAPPLIGISQRSYLGGMLENRPENLIRWIQHPREVNPHTAMPEQGVTNADARDMAAYLYSTR